MNQRVVEVTGTGDAQVTPLAPPTIGEQVDALIVKVKQRPKLFGTIAAAVIVVLLAVGILGARGGDDVADYGDNATSTGEVNAGVDLSAPPEQSDPEPEPEPVLLTIAGEQHSADETYLSLRDLELTQADVEAICQMTNLEELSIYDCYSDDDFAFLPQLTNLKSLDWTLSNGEYLTQLTGCTQLTSLYIGWGGGFLVSPNLDFLAGMTEMESLDIHVYGLEDTSALKNLTKVTHFSIDGGQISADMSVLAGMTEMEELYINQNSIRKSEPYDQNGYFADDLSFLVNMSKLKTAVLIFDENVDDLTGLEGAVELRELDLDVGNVPTLEPLASLVNLRQLNLDITSGGVSLEPLRNLEKLEIFVTFSSRRFTDLTALDHIPSVDIRA